MKLGAKLTQCGRALLEEPSPPLDLPEAPPGTKVDKWPPSSGTRLTSKGSLSGPESFCRVAQHDVLANPTATSWAPIRDRESEP